MLARFLVDEPIVTGARLALRGDELHHAARVVRVRSGERIEIFDGRGSAAEARVVEVKADAVLVEVGEQIPSREASVEIVLAAALISPDRFELVLQKGCELGVSRFVPMVTERIETRVERVRGKLDRWERILLEATKQCGRAVLPTLDAPADISEVIASERGIIVFDSDAEADPWPPQPQERMTLLIGPEGGLTGEEIARVRAGGGAVCSLGPRRLRAETAAIAAVTLAESRYGDLSRH